MLSRPLLRQEGNDLVGTSDELVSIPPNRIGGVSTFDDLRIPDAFQSQSWHWGQRWGYYLVFQASCAAFTLIRAVSSVKGGSGGLVA
jgi:hypothetical protein